MRRAPRRLPVFAAFLLALALAACASQPLSQKIANGYQLADSYLTRTEMLYDAGAIDNAAAQTRLDQVRQRPSLTFACREAKRPSGGAAHRRPAAPMMTGRAGQADDWPDRRAYDGRDRGGATRQAHWHNRAGCQ
jgi:hypothetical protein